MPSFVPAGFKMPLEDIRDVDGWVRDRVRRFYESGSPTPDEIEETCNQGMLILLEVHRQWDPARCAVFSKYAMSVFGKRLIDYWRREVAQSGRGHTPQTKQGKRLPTVYHGTVSLESETVAETFGADRALTHFDAVSE